jgi:glucoamylase
MGTKAESLLEGRILRIELLEPANVRWSSDDWRAVEDLSAKPTSFGTYICDLPTQALRAATTMVFTIYWSDRKNWEGRNFEVRIERLAD